MNPIAKILIETKSLHIQPTEDDFFTWTSGKRSPLYCDNRQLISYPKARAEITQLFCQTIKEKYPNTELIAGTATAGIPWAAWIAQELNLPMIYIRSAPKKHGLKSAIEGHIKKDQKTIIIEDLISTGKSSLSAYKFAKDDGLDPQAVISIFNYGFDISKNTFKEHNLLSHSLCELEELLSFASQSNLITENEGRVIERWRSEF